LTFTPTKTYFRKLVWDVTDESPVSMVYRYATTSPCLVTTHRKHVRSHKIHYATFERIMLEFLSAADWKAIAREGTNISADLLTKQESLAKEIVLLCQKFLQKSPSIRLSIRRHVFPSP
jgi:hypothetical protein